MRSFDDDEESRSDRDFYRATVSPISYIQMMTGCARRLGARRLLPLACETQVANLILGDPGH